MSAFFAVNLYVNCSAFSMTALLVHFMLSLLLNMFMTQVCNFRTDCFM